MKSTKHNLKMKYSKNSALRTPQRTSCSGDLMGWIKYDHAFVVTFPVEKWSPLPLFLNLVGPARTYQTRYSGGDLGPGPSPAL